ncbi:DUF4870 family protein [Sulfitobacter sp. 1A13679]|uniref:DUF4870 family protein n=1 Tax=Sulfitobacter sp. 1A13679 TaxID=3368597 RepID=UPI0037450FB4
MTTVDNFEAGGQDRTKLTISYILYLVGFVFPLAALAGLVLAYMQNPSGHRQFIIRTFWMGLLMTFVGGILTFFLIGWFVLLFWAIWNLVRIFSGWGILGDAKDISNPKTWGLMAK